MKPNVICVIMGGGRGTRLHPLTKLRCKPAVPLAGKFRLVDIPISNCLNSGFNRIYVLTQFNTASLHRHIQESYKFDPFGGGFVDILSAEQTESGETWYQGTADAVLQNMHHFEMHRDDLVMILSGDQLYRMDLSEVVRQHKASGAGLTIAAKAMPLDCVEGLGLMRVDENKSICEFVEKPTDPEIIRSLAIDPSLKQSLDDPSKDYALANMGIYVFNRNVLMQALNTNAKDFGKEIIPGMLGKVKMCSYIFDGYWEDIGTVQSFFEANLRLTELIPPFNFYDQNAPVYTRARYLAATKIFSSSLSQTITSGGCILNGINANRAVIGVRSRINEGTSLDNVIMMGADFFETDIEREENKKLYRPNIGIGKNCRIKNAIIDKNARIGDNVVLDPTNKPSNCEEGGIYVRDGILIVLKNAEIPSGTVFA